MARNNTACLVLMVACAFVFAGYVAELNAAAEAPQHSSDAPSAAKKYPASKRVRNPANGHEYQRLDIPLSWREAKTVCEEVGGHLDTATSAEENDFIYENFAKDHVCWLGATDEEKEGAWKWVTGEPFDFTNWFGVEPNNRRGVEHYLEMGDGESIFVKGEPMSYRYGRKWNDHSDAGMHGGVPFLFPVCEWDSPPSDGASRLRALPEGGVDELERYLEELKAFRPDTSPKSTQLIWQAPQCMRRAAERILEREKDPLSDAYQTALRVMLEDLIGGVVRAAPWQRGQVIDLVEMYLKGKLEESRLELADAQLALWAGRVLEKAGETDLAKKAYEKSAESVAKRGENEFVEAAQQMREAARKLGQ